MNNLTTSRSDDLTNLRGKTLAVTQLRTLCRRFMVKSINIQDRIRKPKKTKTTFRLMELTNISAWTLLATFICEAETTKVITFRCMAHL